MDNPRPDSGYTDTRQGLFVQTVRILKVVLEDDDSVDWSNITEDITIGLLLTEHEERVDLLFRMESQWQVRFDDQEDQQFESGEATIKTLLDRLESVIDPHPRGPDYE